jgi:hypothetical protein
MEELIAALIEIGREPAERARQRRQEEAKAAMPPFCARIRLRLGKRLAAGAAEFGFVFADREVRLKPRDAATFDEADWVVATARGFASEPEALVFGATLKTALLIAAAETGNGIDLGDDKSTSYFAPEIVDAIERELGVQMRLDVHGLDVWNNDPPALFMESSATGTVLQPIEKFVENLTRAMRAEAVHDDHQEHALRLLTAAGMSSEPLAATVLAIAAVEFLGQRDARWTAGQAVFLKRLASEIEAGELTETEAGEVRDTIAKLHRLSLRQGVLRLIERLGLNDLKGEWDAIYGIRSDVVHGTRRLTESELATLAERAKMVARDIVFADLGIILTPETTA